MSAPDLSSLAYLWDGTAPEWRLEIMHQHERRLVLTFDAPGPSARHVAAMREVFEELGSKTAQTLWTEVRGQRRVPLRTRHTPVDAPSLVARARARGLTVEVLATSTVSYLPFNTKTSSALLIEDNELATAVGERMLAAGVPALHIEVD